jgi:2-methylcitrate dehydratase PrpD
MERIKVTVPSHLSENVPSVRKAPFEQPVTLKIETFSGHTFSETVQFHKGSPENPASQENLTDKFYDAVAPWMKEDQARLILALSQDHQSHVKDLMHSLKINLMAH